MTTAYAPPTDEALATKALVFLRECKRKEYRQAKRDGDLDNWIRLKVEAAKSYAADLMSEGEWAGNAWNRAIRLHILESNTD